MHKLLCPKKCFEDCVGMCVPLLQLVCSNDISSFLSLSTLALNTV